MRTKVTIQLLCIILVLALIIRIYLDFIFFTPGTKNAIIEYINNSVSDKNNLTNKYLHEEITMEEYLRFYNLDAKLHHVCPQVNRPQPGEISWKKGVYQHVQMKFEDYPENDVYGLGFYYDDRFLLESGQRHIRTTVTIHAPGPIKNRAVLEWAWATGRVTWYVLLWYQGYKNPVGVGCSIQDAAALIRNCSNQFYYQEIVTCVLPEINLLPQTASLVRKRCGKPTTNMEVLIPYPQRHPREIGVCMASFYGQLSTENVLYFVNWMETLNVLGVSEVSINNGSLFFKGEMIKKVFDYYQSVGRLTFTHYPPIHDTWIPDREDDAATESINKVTTGDCIYRNIKRYWYTLIIDMDEIPVPRSHMTYQDFISGYTRRYPNTSSAHCLAMRSSFFYRNQTAGNPEYPLHLPVLRQTLRLRTEPMEVDGVGLSKSFHNTRTMVAAGHHLTWQTHNYKGHHKSLVHQHFTTEDDILIHHYRASCKWQKFCSDSWADTTHDDILPRKYGTKITHQVGKVLNAIGYEILEEDERKIQIQENS